MSSGQSKIFLGNIFHCQNDPAKKQLYRISNEQGGFVIVKRSKLYSELDADALFRLNTFKRRKNVIWTIEDFLGNIFHCQNDPAKKQLYRISNEQGGFVIVKRSKIMAIGRKEDLEQARAQHLADEQDVMVTVLSDRQLLIPGFVDTHIHAPQYPNCGLGYDKPLLEWLQAYTYKLERKYRDLEYSRKVFNAVVRRTLNHGTTTACYFASLFQDASLILVDAVLKYGQRAFIGKINMTTLAPDDYVETPEETIKLTRKFIESVRSKDCELVEPIVTPRFALSLEMDSMIELGQLVKEYNVNVQTHISENTDEVKQVNSKYGLPYANVYDKAGLLTPKTVLAHGIYLTDEELSLLSQRGSSVSHCPDSNTCLKSGMCDVRRLFSFGIKVGLGTDVSGGASPSIVSAMRSALATSINLSFGQKNYKPLNYLDVFYLATLGGAEALSLEHKIGNFEVGKEFDALIVDMGVENGNTDLLLDCTPLELLQKFIYTGDDRNIANVFVAGKSVK